jgi:hypothetical protein
MLRLLAAVVTAAQLAPTGHAPAVLASAAAPACEVVQTCPTTCPPSARGNLSAGVEIPLGPDSQRPGAGLASWRSKAPRATPPDLVRVLLIKRPSTRMLQHFPRLISHSDQGLRRPNSFFAAPLAGDPFVETGDTLHTTLLYLCCLSPDELKGILAVLDDAKHRWPLVSGLRFDRAVCVTAHPSNDDIVVR